LDTRRKHKNTSSEQQKVPPAFFCQKAAPVPASTLHKRLMTKKAETSDGHESTEKKQQQASVYDRVGCSRFGCPFCGFGPKMCQ
jgi:hypothetical protein